MPMRIHLLCVTVTTTTHTKHLSVALAQVDREVDEDMDVRGGGAAAEDARVVKQGYESEDDEAPGALRHRDDDLLDAPPGAVRFDTGLL